MWVASGNGITAVNIDTLAIGPVFKSPYYMKGIGFDAKGFFRTVKRDGRWLIAATGYKRLWEEIAPRASIEGLALTASWWRTDGRSSLVG